MNDHGAANWWSRLRIQHKVWAVLLLLCVPLIAGLSTHLYLVQQLLALQEQRHDLILADEQVNLLRRLAVDIEDGFRGYLLTQQPAFLAPLTEAESKIDQALEHAKQTLAVVSGSAEVLTPIEQQLKDFLRSKHELIADVQRGDAEHALAYVRSGEGLRQSDRFRQELRTIEDRLEQQRESFNEQTMGLSKLTFMGLWIALAGVVVLGWTSSRMLARSLTGPITRLHSATGKIEAEADVAEITELLSSGRRSNDELGQLEQAYLLMARQIREHVRELEVLNTIGHEINTIGPDGVDGVLRRITDRAVELVQADACFVFLRDDRMGCWVVEAASGEWSNTSLRLGSDGLADGRVIAGTARGIRLAAPGEGTRPLGDRVKQTLFAILEPGPARRRAFLDLFAGSGAAGIEALSRGAAHADLRRARRGRGRGRSRPTCARDRPGRPAPRDRPGRRSRLAARPGPRGDDPVRRRHRSTRRTTRPRSLVAALDAARPAPRARARRVVAKHFWRDRAAGPDRAASIERERRFGETALTFYRRARQEDA